MPASAGEWHELGVRFECQGAFARAIDCYRLALRVGGPNPQIAFDLAYAMAETGDLAAAAERYRQVIELDDGRADAWNNFGDLLLTMGEIEAGIDALRHAAELSPDDSDIRFNLAISLVRD